jgi:16S rRNA (cytidine1402-2'-O)-methyltransferase
MHKLYVVATPIGNIKDITERAKEILTEASVVLAEDSRVTNKLFDLLGIKNKTESLHK